MISECWHQFVFMYMHCIFREVDLSSHCIVEVEDKKTKLINSKVSVNYSECCLC